MSQNEYRKFLEGYSPDDCVAFLLIDRRGKQLPRQQRISVQDARHSSFYNGLTHANRAGADVYISMNPLRQEATGRTKADIALVRHLYLDFDMDGDQHVDELLMHPAIATPHMILHTSHGKWQVIWNVSGFASGGAEDTHRRLVAVFRADPAAIDISRVLRVPSFYNNKYDPPFLVSLVRHNGPILQPRDFQHFSSSMAPTVLHKIKSSRSLRAPGACSQSERDWAWTLEQLKEGVSPHAIADQLALRRHDKPSPLYYAQRTVARAELELRSRGPIARPQRMQDYVR